MHVPCHALRAQAHYRAAKAAIALGDFERAAAACDSGLALEPESADFRSLRDSAAKQAAAKQARAFGGCGSLHTGSLPWR